MDCIEKCDNCKRAHNLTDGTLICDVGNKNKIIYDGWQYTNQYYWCNGKYQQQIGIEGRSFLESIKSGKIFKDRKEYDKFKKHYEKLENEINKKVIN